MRSKSGRARSSKAGYLLLLLGGVTLAGCGSKQEGTDKPPTTPGASFYYTGPRKKPSSGSPGRNAAGKTPAPASAGNGQ